MLIFLETLMAVLLFLIGACIFSFLTVVTDRLPKGENLVRGRSHCDHCGKTLSPAELIPVVSYLALGGKCKACGTRIPLRCLISEILGGALFLLTVHRFGTESGLLTLQGAVIFAFCCILYVIAVIDYDTQTIYDRFHVLILLLAVAEIFLVPSHSIRDRLIGAVIISVPMLILALLIPGAFGGGDIKLMAVSGLFLGTAATVVAMFLGVVLGGSYGAVMLKTEKLGKKDKFAFGPYLAVGLGIAAFWGDQIAAWYLHFL